MDKEWKIRRSGEFSISYTSQNAWTILMSPGNSRIWHLKTPIWIFWCLRVPTTLFPSGAQEASMVVNGGD